MVRAPKFMHMNGQNEGKFEASTQQSIEFRIEDYRAC
jgi:hypothetical protein